MASQLGQLLVVVLLVQTASSSITPPRTSGRILLQYNPTSSIQQVRADVVAQGMDIITEFPDLNALLVTPNAVAAASAAAAGATTAAAQAAALSEVLTKLPTVEAAEPEPIMSIPEFALITTGEPTGSPAADGQQGGAAAAAAEAVDTTACPWDGKINVDFAINQDTEGVPYGVKMVQADEPEVKDIAQKYKHKVLFCVLDTGIDTTNKDFKGIGLTGAAVKDPKTGKRYAWNQDELSGHGTHVSGIIAAVHNGKAVVGVSSEGANMFFYRIMPTGQFNGGEELFAWTACVKELDRRKAATKTSDMKAVVSMSYGGAGANTVSKNFLAKLADKRPDVMFVAAAGNEANATYSGGISYPAAYPEVMGVGAVDATGELAYFSNRGSYVSLVAPGVQYLSTIPLSMTPASEYYLHAKDVLTTTPVLPEVQATPDFLKIPTPSFPDGITQPGVSGQLADCGLGTSVCKDAAGKVCLIERGTIPFCQKVINCQEGGGIGAIIYNDASQSLCTALSTATLVQGGCTAPAGGYITTLMLARGQGLALQNALKTGTLNVKIDPPTKQRKYGLGALSGTSMATPNAAAVAGVIWSAHTECTRQEIRAALEATAWMPPAAGAVQGTRNDEYGHGIIQALAAHKYLQQNPCKSAPVNSPSSQELQVLVRIRAENGSSSSQAASALSVVGSWVRVVVRVRDPKGNRPAGDAVVFAITPSDHLKCSKLEQTTREGGVTSIRCQILKAGRVAVKATVTKPGKAAESSSDTSYVVGKRA